MAKRHQFDICTTEGAVGAEAEVERFYRWLMEKTPTERYNYLVNSGWKRLSKDSVVDELLPVGHWRTPAGDPELAAPPVTKQFIRILWRMPEDKAPHLKAMGSRQMNQTRAIKCQIWWDLEAKEVIYRSR